MSASVRTAAAGNPTSPTVSDLALLRAMPARGAAGASPTATPRPGDADSRDGPSVGSAGDVPGGCAPTAATSADTAGTATASRSAFGETLAASMSASPTSPPGATPARGTKARSAAAKSAHAQSAAGLALAVPPPAAGLAPAGLAADSTKALPGDAMAAVGTLANGPGSSANSIASDSNSATAAAETAAPASDVLALAVAQLPGLKPVTQPAVASRNTPSDEPDGPPAADTATAPDTAAAPGAAPIMTAHMPPAALLTAAAHAESGAPPQAQSGAFAGKPADFGTASAALGAAGGTGSAAQQPAASTPPAPSPVSVPVHAEVGSGAWAQELGVRLNWMAQQGISSASLRLSPEQLGPVEVRISVHQNTASVWFGAAQPDTRSALEQALPKLREMFSAQGLNLAHTGVSDQSARGAQSQPQAAVVPAAAALRELNATPIASRTPVHQGLIDTYA